MRLPRKAPSAAPARVPATRLPTLPPTAFPITPPATAPAAVPPISFGPESAEHAATLNPAKAIATNLIAGMTTPTPTRTVRHRPTLVTSSTKDDWGKTLFTSPTRLIPILRLADRRQPTRGERWT